MSDFCHLHVHSEYSLLDGLGKTDELAKEANRLGQKALALTDHGAMHGVIEFHRNCRKNGVKPIIGVEAYQTQWGRNMKQRDKYKDRSRHHLLLLAENITGFKNLLKMSSLAQTEGFYYRPRIDHDTLARYSEGIICTSGCMGAEIPFYLNEEKNEPDFKMAEERLRWYLDVFGKDRFYIELQEHSIPALTKINKQLFQWAKDYDIGLVVTNDVHYVTKDDADPHDALLCVQTGSYVGQKKRMSLSDTGYYLKSEQEMRDTFLPLADLPDSAFTNTRKIAEMCNVDVEDDKYHLPDLPEDSEKHSIPPEIIPPKLREDKDYDAILRRLTEKGVTDRYGDRANSEDVQQRVEHELKIISDLGFSIYFVIVWDMCRFAKDENIWWNMRGSGAGSIVAYVTGITLIDPLKHGLVFERFLNPSRVSMPDFDFDYPDDQRKKMIEYVMERYGSNRVAQIVTFGRMKARSAIRDVGRVLKVPIKTVNELAKNVWTGQGKVAKIKDTIIEDHKHFSPYIKKSYDKSLPVKRLIDIATRLDDTARHASLHPAAIIITDEEVMNYAPVMRSTGKSAVDGIQVVQYEFPICESIGLLKVDFLGLSTLTIMRKASELIKKRHGLDIRIDNLHVDDPERMDENLPPAEGLYELLSKGDTTGVFQVESEGMRRVLKDMKPTKFEHIVAAISLYRPGPIEQIPLYIDRMHGREKVIYNHPILEEILSETYGIIVYQEQTIRITERLAGYTAGEADLLRRAIGKKKEKEMATHKDKFIQGAIDNGVDEGVATETFELIEHFALYGFNKSHASDYALVTCQTAYFKHYFPLEYMAAMLTVERENSEKIGKFIDECRSIGINILPPCVNESSLEFDIEGNGIRFGLSALKHVGDSSVRKIIKEREENGKYKDLIDLAERANLTKLNKKGLTQLIKVGALSCFNEDKGALLSSVDSVVKISKTQVKSSNAGQLNMFGKMDVRSKIKTEQRVEISRLDELSWEKEILGVYLSGHPVNRIKLKNSDYSPLSDVKGRDSGDYAVYGLCSSVKKHNDKRGYEMAFAEIEDSEDRYPLVVFSSAWADNNFHEGDMIAVKGYIDSKRGSANLIVLDVMVIDSEGSQIEKPEPPPRKIGLLLDANKGMKEERERMKEIIKEIKGKGSTEICVIVRHKSGREDTIETGKMCEYEEVKGRFNILKIS